MNEMDTTQAIAAPARADRSRVYAPWMIGVFVVFAVCEGLFFTWGEEASAYAILGLFAGIVFMVLRSFWVRGKWTWSEALVLLAIVVILALLLFPAAQRARESARRMACASNMKQLGLALLNYERDHGSFPPAFVADATSRKMHSWRTLILPYIEQESLYKEYDIEKPWDSPENQKPAAKSVPVFQCPSCPGPPDQLANRTDYVAVLGEDTFWSTDGSPRSLKDLEVDPSNVAMLIEISNSDIPWHEPRDVQLADLLSDRLLWRETAPHGELARSFYKSRKGRHVVFADGSVRIVPDDLTPDQLRRLFSITEPFDVETEIVGSASRPIVFRHVVFYVWLATLLMQLLYTFFPARKAGAQSGV